MASIEIQPIHEPDLPDIADFIYAYELEVQRQLVGDELAMVRSASENLAFLRWAFVANPIQREDYGFQMRTDGRLVGFHPVCPFPISLGDRSMLGLTSTSFYCDADVRLQAFGLFKRFLTLPDADFYLASSCNEQSAKLWARCGGKPVPGTDVDWLVPIHGGALVREAMQRRGWAAVMGLASMAAKPFDLWLRWCIRSGRRYGFKKRSTWNGFPIWQSDIAMLSTLCPIKLWTTFSGFMKLAKPWKPSEFIAATMRQVGLDG